MGSESKFVVQMPMDFTILKLQRKIVDNRLRKRPPYHKPHALEQTVQYHVWLYDLSNSLTVVHYQHQISAKYTKQNAIISNEWIY